jgi:imidazolonepropionase-like amidohydrolase
MNQQLEVLNVKATFSREGDQPGGLRESSRRSKRSVDLRAPVDDCSHPGGVPRSFWHPSGVPNKFSLATGGLRYALTTGYYLSRLRRKGLASQDATPILRRNQLQSVPLVTWFLPLLVLLACLPAAAQQIGNPTTQDGVMPPRGTYAIRNAHIVTVSGADIENGTIVIRDGKIAALGASISVPAGAQIIEGRGLTVYPGMIDAGTSLGLTEVGQGAAGTVDTTEVGDLNPNAKAIIAINPHSAHLAVTRVDGVTTAVTLPVGGLIAGQAAIINLVGTTPLEMALVPYAALVINYPRIANRAGDFGGDQQPTNLTETLAASARQVEQIRKMLKDAEAYGRAQDAYAKDKSLPRPDQNVVLESLVPYVRGERPVIFRADRESEMRGAIRFAEELKLKPVILGGDEAWRIASFLKEKNVPVILTGILDLPTREDDFYDSHYENAAKLQQAGVRFCISSGDSGAGVRNLPNHAGMAAAFGLSKTEALKSVTLYPAQIMNVSDRVGSIEVGKIANLVVTDGDLLETRTAIRHLFIDGREVKLESRHTDLYDAFKNRK